MEQINVSNKLKPIHMSQFLSDNPTNVTIIVEDGEPMTIDVATFRQFHFLPIDSLEWTTKLTFKTDTTIMTLVGVDYLYWSETEKRVAKLFNVEVSKQIKTSTKAVMTIAVANITEDGLQNIKSCTGVKKDLVIFMNDEIRNRTIDNGEDVLVVFKFDYTEADNNDIAAWLSLDELAEKGLIELR